MSALLVIALAASAGLVLAWLDARDAREDEVRAIREAAYQRHRAEALDRLCDELDAQATKLMIELAAERAKRGGPYR